MSHELQPSSFRHLLRVRLGVNGPKGRLYRCESKYRPGTIYWRVKLDTGERAHPHGLVIDGKGDSVRQCLECGAPFITDTELLCRLCDESAFGTMSRANEPRFERGFKW